MRIRLLLIIGLFATSGCFASSLTGGSKLNMAMGDEATRTVDYVVTLAFVNAAGFAKARALAQLPVP